MKKTDKVLELLKKCLADEDNTCGDCFKLFENYGMINYPDFVDCKSCGANFSIQACNLQKKNNFKRMSELLRKMERTR